MRRIVSFLLTTLLVAALLPLALAADNVCPKCGAPLEPGASFCTRCGQKIEGVPALAAAVLSRFVYLSIAVAGPFQLVATAARRAHLQDRIVYGSLAIVALSISILIVRLMIR